MAGSPLNRMVDNVSAIDRVSPRTGRRRLAGALGAVVLGAVVLLGQILLAGPASAHAELLKTSPRNGQRLATPPAQITLTFSEKVDIVSGGLRLIDSGTGDQVTTPDPRAVGSAVVWPMPPDLPDGAYLVSWRMISADSHPVAGAFSFGIGANAAPVANETTATGAPWQMSVTRWAGYLAFALVAGVVAFACLCWPEGRRERRMDILLRSGMIASVLTTALLLLLQGPYEAGVSYLRLLDPDLLSLVAHSDFGPWIELRALLFLALAALLWDWGALANAFNRWAAGVALLAAAVTFSGTGHAASSGALLDRATDTVHVLGASVWVGGLAVLAALSVGAGVRPGRDAFARFSRLALTSVVVVVATGTVNALLRLTAWSQLWDSRYGVLLSVKILLVAAVLAVASFSRRAVGRGEEPWQPVRVEAVGAAAILAITSVLTFTAPPTTVQGGQNDLQTVEIPLEEGRQAEVAVRPPSTGGSRIVVTISGEQENSVSLRASYPGPFDVPLRRTARGWVGPFEFTFAGDWTLTVTVQFPHLDAPVAAGTVTIQ
jgi:copper transport protein